VARPEGLEPPTLCFEGRCSIQLSYGRVGLSILNHLSRATSSFWMFELREKPDFLCSLAISDWTWSFLYALSTKDIKD
jgi:hypothetical protein